MQTSLHIGGLVAVGFDSTGKYLLTISHTGRGVFSTDTWRRVASDKTLSYPTDGASIGIGSIGGEVVPVKVMDFDAGFMRVVSRDGKIVLNCESSGIDVQVE